MHDDHDDYDDYDELRLERIMPDPNGRERELVAERELLGHEDGDPCYALPA